MSLVLYKGICFRVLVCSVTYNLTSIPFFSIPSHGFLVWSSIFTLKSCLLCFCMYQALSISVSWIHFWTQSVIFSGKTCCGFFLPIAFPTGKSHLSWVFHSLSFPCVSAYSKIRNLEIFPFLLLEVHSFRTWLNSLVFTRLFTKL